RSDDRSEPLALAQGPRSNAPPSIAWAPHRRRTRPRQSTLPPPPPLSALPQRKRLGGACRPDWYRLQSHHTLWLVTFDVLLLLYIHYNGVASSRSTIGQRSCARMTTFLLIGS